MGLKATKKEKTKSSQPCKHCTKEIQTGEQYISVVYSDGFKNRPFGAYHAHCWKISPDNPINNKEPDKPVVVRGHF